MEIAALLRCYWGGSEERKIGPANRGILSSRGGNDLTSSYDTLFIL